jgi:hypothetical protein
LRSNLSEVRRTPLDNRQQTDQPDLLIRRLTPAELKERKDKGLCFKCNKKYGLGHQCKRLFMIEACRGEDGDEDVLMSEDEDEGESIKGQFPFFFFLEDKGNVSRGNDRILIIEDLSR